MAESVLAKVREALDMDAKTFTAEWKKLSQKDRDELKALVTSG